MFTAVSQIQKHLTFILGVVLFLLCVQGFVQTQALTSADVNISVPTQCSTDLAQIDVKIWDLPNISKFLPIIPQSCALTAAGEVQPLGIKVIPDIIIRLIGFLFTFAFYVMPLAVILLGYNLFLKPFDPSVNKTQFTEITTLPRLIAKQLAGFVIGLVLILFSYTIVFTILNLLGFQGEYTKLDRFFS